MATTRFEWCSQRLREATQLKKSGNLDDAIGRLRLAYGVALEDGLRPWCEGAAFLAPQEWLRLPMYLQAAGRADEGWREFMSLTDPRHPLMRIDPSIVPMHESMVYDKMRLFLQREGNHVKAVTYAVASYCMWCKGCRLQREPGFDRENEIDARRDPAEIRRQVGPVLKKAGLDHRTTRLVIVVQSLIERPEELTMTKVREAVSSFLLAEEH